MKRKSKTNEQYINQKTAVERYGGAGERGKPPGSGCGDACAGGHLGPQVFRRDALPGHQQYQLSFL